MRSPTKKFRLAPQLDSGRASRLASAPNMDCEFSDEPENFRTAFPNWLASDLPAELCLDGASDDRVASDRETFERRRVWVDKGDHYVINGQKVWTSGAHVPKTNPLGPVNQGLKVPGVGASRASYAVSRLARKDPC
jgi:hypothetical protein